MCCLSTAPRISAGIFQFVLWRDLLWQNLEFLVCAPVCALAPVCVSGFYIDRRWFKRAHSGTYQSAALPAVGPTTLRDALGV